MTVMDPKQARVALLLKKAEADTREAADAVVALAKVLANAPVDASIDHAFLVRHALEIEVAAKRACKGIAAWRKNL